MRAALLDHADLSQLQLLHDRCSDFFVLTSGAPAPPDAAEEMVHDLPPGRTLADKFVVGCWVADQLVAAADLVRGLRRSDDWCIGLFLVTPALRNHGRGTAILTGLLHWLASMGASSVCLVVQKQNIGALRFWTRSGFQTYEATVQRFGSLNNEVLKMEMLLRDSEHAQPGT
ncbi:MAG: GNAT family N-acetyltransferase [Myxococcota bacterium]|nr:GNAT family N-acetyltransferase [Myxococcota bacterium]